MSKDLNQCNFIGRAGKDCETRYLPNGNCVANFSIAVGDQWKKDNEKHERTEWVNITAWGKLGEICGEYVKKGQQVFISGQFRTDTYEKDGQTRYATKIFAQQMQLIGNRSDSSGGASNQNSQHNSAASQQGSTPNADFDDSEDIPF